MVTHSMLQRYRPTASDQFDATKAAHLLNRAGFGGTPEEIAHVQKLGPADAVDWLLDFPDAGAEERDDDLPDFSAVDGFPRNFMELRQRMQGLDEEQRKQVRQQLMITNRQVLVETAAWWLRRMAHGQHPLQEKLTLLWHGHFTTSARDERSALLMWKQNELLRAHAAGNFHEFVQAISRDPAMLDYLNNSQNRKKHPNENYARELMELFTLGLGNYSENDVKEAARAFTGWTHDGEDFVFRHFQHDDGEKVFLGKRGNFDGDDIIEIIMTHSACARYIATKLFREFAYETSDTSTSAALGNKLREAKYELRPLLRTILTSRAFYSPQAIGTQIKSPIQLVVGTVRLLDVEMPQSMTLGAALNQMGQVPFLPPNVKGWPGGRSWINTSTLFVRYNTAAWLAGGAAPQGGPGFARRLFQGRGAAVGFDPADSPDDPQQLVDHWLARLIQRPLDPQKRQVLLDAVAGGPKGEAGAKNLVQLIVSMPDYQLC